MMVHADSGAPPSQRDDPTAISAAMGRRLPGPDTGVLLGGMIALFVGTFVWLTWLTHARFGTFGFDLGIFDQGVWLLSRFQDPFVTIRGLPLFGDHASYILLLVAPLYWIWADPRLLLVLQVLCLAIPAVSLYLIGTRRLGSPLAGLAVAAAYLAFPALQWAAIWSFHPETLAAGFLGLAALAADRQRWRQMAVWLALALLCKEDVGLVVAGFGALLWITGQPTVGRRTLAAGLGWFLLTALVLIPLANGRASPHLELNFGITGSGPSVVLEAVPTLVGNAWQNVVDGKGGIYLLLIFTPLLGLPLLDPRWLLPAAPPILLNLAATHGYQQEIRYQYLATAAPFLALATIAGLQVVARRQVVLAGLLVALVAVAGFIDYRVGPAPWSKDFPRPADAGPIDDARRQALGLIDPTAPVSAQYNLATHLAHRTSIYEFPNPFTAPNWGFPGDQHQPAEIQRLRYVVVERPLLGEAEAALLDRLRGQPQWRTLLDRQGIVVLERVGP
ncbi:MAG: hypothetical protein K0S88_595 [Actinomycetia bacterium]|nr:hypothetical protein [Actinomycetes bacterium]